MDYEKLKLSQDDLIKILDFVCKNKSQKVTPELIQQYLYPDLGLEEVNKLLTCLIYKRIEPITIVQTGDDVSHLVYRKGLEECVWNLKEKEKRNRLHRIVEYLSTQSTNSKLSFDTEEVAKAFSPALTNYEAIRLCETLIANGDVINAPTDQSDSRDVLNIIVTPRTRAVYENKKYLEEQVAYRVSPTIVSHDNISIIGGSNYRNISQKNHSVKTVTKTEKGLPSWANWLIVIATVLGAIAAIIGIFLIK
jgi:hypothetical protein